MYVELFLNWLLLPHTSVVGHVSGILAGLLYYEWRALPGTPNHPFLPCVS